ncbi:MAG: dihydropteroate synthase [Alphaproteobacteria bacterium]
MSFADRFVPGARTWIMGIVNVTSDSFSGDGILDGAGTAARAVAQAEAFLDAGADILDIGGESTRPGASPVGAVEEAARVLPAIRAIKQKFPDAVLSVDTYRATVARQAVDAGAEIVNDVWALQADADMAGVVAGTGVHVVLMHNRSRAGAVTLDPRLGGQYRGADYGNVVEDVAADLAALAAAACDAGVAQGRIMLDPGIGFGKTVAQNLALLNHLDRLTALGYPLLVGTSRKSFIGQVLDAPVEGRLDGTAATVALAIARGASVIRVHDVAAMVRVARMTDAILRAPVSASDAAD